MYGGRTAGIEDLPPHLAAAVVRQAFDAEGRRLLPWLRLSLVSRRWRDFMSDEAVEMELPIALSKTQYDGLVTTRIPVRSLRFTRDDDFVPAGMLLGPWALRKRLELQPGSVDTLAELHNVPTLPKYSPKWLHQLTGLRVLSLDMDLSSKTVTILPTSLTCLDLFGCDRFEDMRFTHLTALRDLTLRHEASSMQFAARPFSLTALPPSLRRLYLRLPSDSVRLFPCGNPRLGNVRPGVPAAPTEVLQIECRRLVFGDVRSVTRLPASCAVTIRAHTLHFKADAYGDDNRLLRGSGGARACVAAWLAAWMVRCQAASVSLAGWRSGTEHRPQFLEVLVGRGFGQSDAATFAGPIEIAALMSGPCEALGRSCRLVSPPEDSWDVRMCVD